MKSEDSLLRRSQTSRQWSLAAPRLAFARWAIHESGALASNHALQEKLAAETTKYASVRVAKRPNRIASGQYGRRRTLVMAPFQAQVSAAFAATLNATRPLRDVVAATAAEATGTVRPDANLAMGTGRIHQRRTPVTDWW